MPYSKYHVRKRDLFTIALGSEPGFVQAVKAKQKKIAAKQAEEQAAAAAAAAATNTAAPPATATEKVNMGKGDQQAGPTGGEKKDSTKPDEGHEFTPEQDKQLLRMKLEKNKTWKEIAEALGRSTSTVKSRFKDIKPKDEDKPAEQRQEKSEETKGEKKENKAETSNQRKGRNDSSEQEPQSTQPANTSYPHYVQLNEDELFSFDELKMLSEIMQEDLAAFYPRVRDRFYDLTNRRLKVDFIRAKCRAEDYPEGDPYC